ncbi:MAG TPA: single-stranded DNA-binding protein [Polyangiaceae bacterium]|jgi:single-strand DNA-binding protein|nr:single-stranded DNA-binding protein [Polyangiaceae bacterium]
MADGLNKVLLLGNLGADPELKMTSGGQAVLKMRLATTETYLDRNKVRQEKTEWHSVVLWGKRAEALSRFLTKGSRLFIEGGLRTSSYDDREGNKRYKTEIVAMNVILAGGRGAPGGAGGGGGGPAGGGGGGGGGGRESGPADDYEDQPPYGGAGGGAGAGGGSTPAGGGDDDDIPF